ncbi:MAG TPA: hypothetical protein DCZ92_11405 [Elusimicrobia bacterium]|nr:MAG: hypothetical protein A2016_02360 [Elusimicrobia bacterium GWF2_62_30]HBA61399.1 hypothetical protein [Elusimicrobiota bacterium]
MRNIIRALVLCALTASAASALDVTATEPAAIKGAAKGDFSFKGLTVRGITWEKDAVVMPVTENKGRTYFDVKLLSKKLYGKLETCFKSGCARPPARVPGPVVKVDAVKPLKSKSRVANAELSFDGELMVVVGIMASSKEPGTIWLAFPETVDFKDEALKASVEKSVKDAWGKKAD